MSQCTDLIWFISVNRNQILLLFRIFIKTMYFIRQLALCTGYVRRNYKNHEMHDPKCVIGWVVALLLGKRWPFSSPKELLYARFMVLFLVEATLTSQRPMASFASIFFYILEIGCIFFVVMFQFSNFSKIVCVTAFVLFHSFFHNL